MWDALQAITNAILWVAYAAGDLARLVVIMVVGLGLTLALACSPILAFMGVMHGYVWLRDGGWPRVRAWVIRANDWMG